MPTPRTPRPISRRAFTLVEILVVIGIIALLISILTPVLGAAKRRAGAAVCASRLSGIAAAVTSYTSDHRGELPTFDYPEYPTGEAEAIPVPEWLDEGGWVVVPFSETTFWAYQLREYVAADPVADHRLVTESLSCPAAHDAWKRDRELHHHDKPLNAMLATQQSYMKSVALFTEPGAWTDRAVTPDVNFHHAPVLISNVRHTSSKTMLVERTSFHDDDPQPLIDRRPGASHTLLAVDGHVRTVTPSDATEPHGFTAAGTGLEHPSVDPDAWEGIGIPFISTHLGAHGRDW